jgi:FlaA1/EpsC-like NDP-sugar epimerase
VNNCRKRRIAILCLLDIVAFVISLLFSFYIVEGTLNNFAFNFLIIIALQIAFLFVFKVYNIRLLDSSLDLAYRGASLFIVDFIFTFVYLLINNSYSTSNILRIYITYSIISYISVMGYRVVYRYVMYSRNKRISYSSNNRNSDRKKAIVYGAGELGKALVNQSIKGNLKYNIVGFIDDDQVKADTFIVNTRVLGNIDKIKCILTDNKADILIIAITQLSADNMQKIVSTANELDIEVKIVPSLFEMESEHKKSIDLRTVNYSDLLGRKLIEIDKQPIKEMIEGKVVLVTGACGSIGSEIARQARSYNPKQLLLLDIDESGLHDNALRLLNYKSEWSDEVMPILCDIKNKEKINQIMEQYKPDIIFHAAAYKHVPMVQLYPEEGIRTNVGGSYNVLEAAKKNKVKKVVVISTDKAVNPTNVMGATKRMVELEAAMLNSPETEIVCVRFGNVIGSRGSMLPIFVEEIKAGVPITVTDKKIIRYFMAIPEAVSLVFLAGSMGKGGEVMVLDMGKPINIYEFAKRLISMYGDPNKNEIHITGLRPGEKMYEELLANKDNTISTDNKLIFKAKLSNSTLDKKAFLSKLNDINITQSEELKDWVKKAVPEFEEK